MFLAGDKEKLDIREVMERIEYTLSFVACIIIHERRVKKPWMTLFPQFCIIFYRHWLSYDKLPFFLERYTLTCRIVLVFSLLLSQTWLEFVRITICSFRADLKCQTRPKINIALSIYFYLLSIQRLQEFITGLHLIIYCFLWVTEMMIWIKRHWYYSIISFKRWTL